MKTKSTIKTKNLTLLGTAVLAGILSGLNPVSANPILADFVDDPRCDAPTPHRFIEELGEDFPGNAPIFFPDELISTTSVETQLSTCDTDNPQVKNYQVDMKNQTKREFTDLYFVSDFSPVGNADGKIGNAAQNIPFEDAFRIDKQGINKPLLAEIPPQDPLFVPKPGVFQPNETWQFLIVDYALPPNQLPIFGSAGLASNDPFSNSNIVVTPEPTTMLGSLLVFGSGALLKGKMKKK